MKFKAAVFFPGGYSEAFGHSPEDALEQLSKLFPREQGVFTYKPANMAIYFNSSHIPCGVIMEVEGVLC